MATFLGAYQVQTTLNNTMLVNTTGVSNKDGWGVLTCGNSDSNAIINMESQSPIGSVFTIWVEKKITKTGTSNNQVLRIIFG